MSKSQKFFRYVWRLNAVLILVAAAAVSFGVGTLFWLQFGESAAQNRAFEASPPLGADSDERRLLDQVELVEGTSVLRGKLLSDRSALGSSSGSYNEVRNLLFVDDQSPTARWLLPDDDHVITKHSDVMTRAEGEKRARPVATFTLVKPAGADLRATEGLLLLFDPAGRNVQTVADGVRELHTAELEAEGRITVLFERRRKYVLASFDGRSLERNQEREITIPTLK
jgi:hypothetical protein